MHWGLPTSFLLPLWRLFFIGGIDMEWQPIETAPKGRRGYAWMRLAWGPDENKNTGDGFCAEGKFFASACYFKLSGFPAFEYRQIEVTPTHWMPRPEPPK